MKYVRRACQSVLIAVLVSALPAQTKSGVVETVSGTGCLRAGVEGGCLVLYDPETRTGYNLFFKGAKPALGTPIQFTGTFDPHRVGYCMQGKIVNVTEWHQTGSRCAPQDKK